MKRPRDTTLALDYRRETACLRVVPELADRVSRRARKKARRQTTGREARRRDGTGRETSVREKREKGKKRKRGRAQRDAKRLRVSFLLLSAEPLCRGTRCARAGRVDTVAWNSRAVLRDRASKARRVARSVARRVEGRG